MKRLLEQPRLIIIVFLALAAIMIASALIELYQSRIELYQLMEDQSHTLLESLIISSGNVLTVQQRLEESNRDRLLNNANLIRTLYDRGEVSDRLLREIAKENRIFRINIFRPDRHKIFSSHMADPEHGAAVAPETLRPIFDGTADTLILGLKRARLQEGFRFAVAVAAKNRSAVVVNIDAQAMLNLRRETGFGVLLRKVVDNPGIVFVALQDTNAILAASGNVSEMESILDSEFLTSALRDSLFLTRTSTFDSVEVLEAVHPFVFNGKVIGLFRLGLSLDPIKDINQRVYRRLIIITIVLIMVGTIVFTLIIVRQRYDILEKQYHVVETYTGNIIRYVSDAILVYDEVSGIKIFNQAAENIFQKKETNILGQPLAAIAGPADSQKMVAQAAGTAQIECMIGNEKKFLLLSKTEFSNDEGVLNTILVIRDLTRQRRLEAQIQRKERLSAMGELASGVAHEIRNPLNTIGTIIQQLDKDFTPAENPEEFHELAQLVHGEVKRINKTVSDFLKFSRPDPIQPVKFRIDTLLQQIALQYQTLLQEKNTEMEIRAEWHGEVFWDQSQIRQVLINLIQNAIDAIEDSGKILVTLRRIRSNEISISIRDNGKGIPDEIRNRIFNLYFTTKAKGTGIGLSIVQRIIYEHEGVISVESQVGSGTTFHITLPQSVTPAKDA
jgi:two-component system sensor histidine kinase HydH